VLLFFSLLLADDKFYKDFEINSSFKSPFITKITKTPTNRYYKLICVLNGYAYIKSDKKTLWYKKGDKISGAVIKKVYFDRVVLKNGLELKIKRH